MPFNFDCNFVLIVVNFQLLDELQTDQWQVPPGSRSSRCTGVALSVAAGLLGACVPGTGARIIALVGGPCTEGPGTVSFFYLLCYFFIATFILCCQVKNIWAVDGCMMHVNIIFITMFPGFSGWTTDSEPDLIKDAL